MQIIFKEEQKFSQWWIWLILIGLGFLPLYGLFKQLIIREQFGDRPMSDAGLIFLAVVVFSLIVLFWSMRLRTEIDEDEIRMHFFPFVRKSIKWTEIKNAKTVNYGFVGGWGIRFWTKYGTVYNTKGNKGLAIELKNGKKFLIGTQRESELSRIIERFKR